jgi:hypothetical protein
MLPDPFRTAEKSPAARASAERSRYYQRMADAFRYEHRAQTQRAPVSPVRREQLRQAGIASGASRRSYRADRGGHAPGHLRDAFRVWIADGMCASTVLVGAAERKQSLGWLLGKLWNCTDILPSIECQELEISQGSTYAQAVRLVRYNPDRFTLSTRTAR